jgi:hypothetical protein
MIKINVEKAKEIRKNQIRRLRKSLLEKKDVEYMRALEIGDTQKVAQVVAEKQALRDVTNLVTEAEITSTDVNEVTRQLKQIWDEDLLGPNPHKIPQIKNRVRARNEDGTFIADDPTTPDINEVWIET